jgi:hypothetical protein
MEVSNVLAGVGLTILFVYATPLRPLRSLLSFSKFTKELVTCTLCVGFWVGVGLSIIHMEWTYAPIVPIVAWMYDAIHGRLIGEY